jgi:fibronectin type 3 domain-containing protein
MGTERILSRREFLKLLGYGAITLAFAPLVRFGGLQDLKKIIPSPAAAQSAGSWALGQNTTAVAIHAAIIPSGKIFYLAGSGYHRDRPNGPFDARILDINTGSEKNLPLTEDLFCIGITHLPNGNVLMAGGTLMYDTNPDNLDGDWYGLSSTYEVDAQSENLVRTASMAHGRWYPTLVTLPDGKAVVVNGLDECGSYNLLMEVYDPVSKTWSPKFNPNSNNTYCVGRNANGTIQKKPGSGSPCYGGTKNGTAPNVGQYPRMHLMPSGLIIYCGGQPGVKSWDPVTGRWSGTITQSSTYRHYGASFLLPLHNTSTEKGKILLVGGSVLAIDDVEQYATTAVEILDFDQSGTSAPVDRQVAPITYRRKMAAPVILPDGKCVVFGGSEKGNTIPVRIPEMFDPVTETWQALPSATVNRVYHQVSLLLPDGRVWTAGSTVASGVEELRTEIFSPAYMFQTRPTIIAMPNVGGYGGTINILTPDAANINSVSLVRLMSCTHHYEANQRLIWLQIVNRGPGDITVSAPINPNVAPPGYYMIHVLNGSGVPSVAKVIQIPGTGTGVGGDTTPPAKVIGLSVTPATGTQLNLSWSANSEQDLNHYNVYRGTVPGFSVNPITDTPLAQPTTNSYSDNGLTESTTYYYRVAGVDNSGNISVLSDEASGTTTDSTAPSKVLALAAIPFSSNRIDLSWTANSEPDLGHYNIYRATTAGFVVNPAADTPLAQPTTNTFSDTAGLVESTTYYYRVAAVDNAVNIGPLSDETFASTGDSNAPAKVSGLTATAVGSNRIDLGWTTNNEPDLNHYNVYRGTTAGFVVDAGTDSPSPLAQPVANSYSDSSVVDSTTYYYKVAAVDNSGNIGILSDEASTTAGDSTAPNKVIGLTVTPFSSSRLDLAWTANSEPDLDHYNVYRGTSIGFPVNPTTDTPLAQPNTNSYSDTNGLVESTTYYYKVAAVDNAGNIGILSDEVSSSTGDSTAPAKVVGLSVTTISSSQLDLAWTANTEPDMAHYNVYRGTTAGFTVNLGSDTPLAQPVVNSYSDTSGLTESTTYFYKVAAVDNAGNIGILSNESSGIPGGVFYDVPSPGNKTGGSAIYSGTSTRLGEAVLNPSSALIGKRLRAWKVRLKKSGSPSGLVLARVRRSDDTVVTTFNESIDSTTLGTAFAEYTFTLTNPYTIQNKDMILIEYGGPASVQLDTWSVDKFDGSLTGRTRYDGTKYTNGLNEDIVGTMSSVAPVIIDTTPPSKVTGLTVTPLSGSQLNLNWTANQEPDLNHYNIYRSITSGFQVNTSTDTPIGQPNTNSYNDNNGLSESTKYYYRIAAVDNTGNIGTLSDEKSGTTLDSIAPAKVLGLVVTTVSSTRLDLSWTANSESDLSYYMIYRSTTPGFAVNFTSDLPIAQPTTNSYSNIEGLSPSTAYYYRVVAVDSSGNIGELSDEGTATTSAAEGDVTPPSKVTGLTASNITANSLDLTWTANTESDLDHYNVYRGTTAGFLVNSSTVPLGQTTTNNYSDTGLSQSTTYYYRVVAVDTSQNKGSISDEVSATTLTQVFYDVPIPGNAAGALKNGSPSTTRFGEEAFNLSSILVGKSLKSWKVRLRKAGTPSGLVTAKIRKNPGDTVAATFNESIDSTTLGTAFSEYTFTLTTPYTIQKGDRIMVEYDGPSAVHVEIWNPEKIDGSNTRRIRFGDTGYAANVSEDVCGTMSNV